MWRDIELNLYAKTPFDHINLPSMEDLENRFGFKIKVSGTFGPDNKQTMCSKLACQFLATYIKKIQDVTDWERKRTKEDLDRILAKFKQEREDTVQQICKTPVGAHRVAHYGCVYSQVVLGRERFNFRWYNQSSPCLAAMYWSLKEAIELSDLPKYDALWKEALRSFGFPRLQEIVTLYKNSYKPAHLPLTGAITDCIRHHGCPLAGLSSAINNNRFYCIGPLVANDAPNSSLVTMPLAHERLGPLTASSMGIKERCLFHALWIIVSKFYNAQWALQKVPGFTDSKQNRTNQHVAKLVSAEELLRGSFNVQAGVANHFVPLLQDNNTCWSCCHFVWYVLKAAPAPSPRYKVEAHLLKRTTLSPLEMTKYMDPHYPSKHSRT